MSRLFLLKNGDSVLEAMKRDPHGELAPTVSRSVCDRQERRQFSRSARSERHPLIRGPGRMIKIVQSKYLNKIVEHPFRGLQANLCRAMDHRSKKRITRPMLGCKTFHSAAVALAEIETAHMIRKGQFGQNGAPPFKQFTDLAA